MIKGVLTYKDYDEIIDHCTQTRTRSEATDFLVDIILTHPPNTYLELNIADRIITRFPKSAEYYLVDDMDDVDGNVTLKRKAKTRTDRDRRINWLYELLLGLLLREPSKHSLPTTCLRNNASLQADQQLSKEHLKEMWEMLNKEGFCLFQSFDEVSWIFEGEIQGDKRIGWIGDKVNKPNYQRLIEVLNIVFANFSELPARNKSYWIKARFVDAHGNEFKSGLEKAIQRNNEKRNSHGKTLTRERIDRRFLQFKNITDQFKTTT